MRGARHVRGTPIDPEVRYTILAISLITQLLSIAMSMSCCRLPFPNLRLPLSNFAFTAPCATYAAGVQRVQPVDKADSYYLPISLLFLFVLPNVTRAHFDR